MDLFDSKEIMRVMKHLDEYNIEGDRKYLYHPEGCSVAPTVNIEEALQIMKYLGRIARELAGVRDAALDGSCDCGNDSCALCQTLFRLSPEAREFGEVDK